MYRIQPSVDPLEELRLNFDILRLVCDHLTDVPDVLSLSRTCSALQEDALRRRLRMAPVKLLNAELLNSFHTFIFSNAPSRAPHVYGLQFLAPYYYQVAERSDSLVVDRRLASILVAAVHIQYLDFATSISPLVFDAVIKLTTVRELRVFTDAYQQPLCARLSAFRSPLRYLHVERSGLTTDSISASYLHDRLSHLAPTLEFLDLDDFPISIPPSSVTTQFTTVRSLRLRTPFASDSDTLDVLLRLFPKLHNLLDLGRFLGNIGEDEGLAFQERSKEVQKRHTWSSLDRLVCDALTAFLLALQCPIRRMDIEVRPPDGSSFLARFLCHNSPPKLHVSLTLYSGFSAVLDGLFPIETAEKLTHLVIFANLGVRYSFGARRKANNVHWDRFIVSPRLSTPGRAQLIPTCFLTYQGKLISSIAHLRRLTHLRIVFHAAVYQSAWYPLPDEDLMQTGRGIDLLPTTARLFDAMPPTLKYLFLTTCGHTYIIPHKDRCPVFRQQTLDRWLSSGACRVVHDKEDYHLLSVALGLNPYLDITGEAAERIMNQEELHLSRHEEVCLKLPLYEVLKLTLCRTRYESAAARGATSRPCNRV